MDSFADEAIRRYLDDAFAGSDFAGSDTDSIANALQSYLGEVLEANKRINLTRIEDSSSAKLLHIEDSLSGLPELMKAPEGDYVDLGSGGGFPGVPLALASGRKTLLVDSVKKKMAAVQGILDTLGFSGQIRTYDGRIEDLAKDCPGRFSAATARALSKLPSLLELASPLLKRNGMLICYKSHISEDERAAALKIQTYLGMKLVSERKFLLSDGETVRDIVVLQKVKEPGLKLPRRIGLAQKKPLA